MNTEPIAFDIGTAQLRFNNINASTGPLSFPSVVGKTKYPVVMYGAVTKDTYIGEDAQTKRSLLSINYPIEHGVVKSMRKRKKKRQI